MISKNSIYKLYVLKLVVCLELLQEKNTYMLDVAWINKTVMPWHSDITNPYINIATSTEMNHWNLKITGITILKRYQLEGRKYTLLE